MATRGIQEIKRSNKDGSIVVRYRVQINRKNLKKDCLFDDENEAIEFLNALKSKTGTNQIKLLAELKKKEQLIIEDFFKNPTLSFYIKKYIDQYIRIRYATYDPATDEGKIKLRNLKSTISFFNKIENTEITEIADESFNMSPAIFRNTKGKKKLGLFKPSQITEIEINEYIKERLREIKPISVQRELTHISNLFKKIRHLDPTLKHLRNPCLDYDRDLLTEHGNLSVKKSYRMTDEERTKLFEALSNYQNQEMHKIVLLMLFTAMRRSEAVLLKWSQVFDDHILLTHTKNKRERVVYLTAEAKEVLQCCERKQGKDRLFDYSVLGFDGSYKKFLDSIDLSHIKSHALRKESISNFIEKIGAGNSLLIAEFLGMGVRKLEEKIDKENIKTGMTTQSDLLKSVGHSNPSITQNFYFSLKKNVL